MAKQTIEIIRGDDATITFTFTDENGAAYNLTDCTVFFTVKSDLDLDDDDAEISKDITSHTTPLSGITAVTLSNSDTDLTPGIYYWDIQIKTKAGKIMSTSYGELEIVRDITKRTS